MSFPIFFLDEGSGGGAGGGEKAAGSISGDDPNSTAGGKEGASGATEGGSTKEAARGTEKPKAGNSGEDLDYKDLHAKSLTEIDQLKKKLGKQGDKVGTYNKLMQGLKDRPQDMIAYLAKKAGVKIKLDSGEQDDPEAAALAKAISTGDNEALSKVLEGKESARFEDRILQKVERMVSKPMKAFMESALASKYDDFDDLADDREIIQGQVMADDMPEEELLHLAARGRVLPEILKAHEKKVIEDYVQKLKEKEEGHIDGTTGKPAKTKTIEDSLDFSDLSAVLNKLPG